MKVVIEKSRVIAWLLVGGPEEAYFQPIELWRNEMRYEDERIFLPEQIDPNKILGMVAGSGSVAVRLFPLTENGTFHFDRNGEVINKFVGYESEGTESEQPWDSMCAEAQADPEAHFYFPKEYSGKTSEKDLVNRRARKMFTTGTKDGYQGGAEQFQQEVENKPASERGSTGARMGNNNYGVKVTKGEEANRILSRVLNHRQFRFIEYDPRGGAPDLPEIETSPENMPLLNLLEALQRSSEMAVWDFGNGCYGLSLHRNGKDTYCVPIG